MSEPVSHPTAPAADPRIPRLSLILGFGPVGLIVLLAAAAWLLPRSQAWMAVAWGQLWGAILLLFLAGVRRGLSFFTVDGPRPAQVVTSIWLFLTGLAGIALAPADALLAILLGFASVALLDTPAARRGEAPAHFARLRPAQMAVALVGTGGLLARVILS